MRVAIIGAGLQCRRRAPVFKDCKEDQLKVIAGATLESARKIADTAGCEASDDWQKMLRRDDIDAVLVLTPPYLHAAMTIAALRAGKHVLCEKPLARTLAEAEEMVRVQQTTRLVLKCGFNHRHHPAIRKAKEYFDRGELGEPIFARCRYGICGRPGYEREWRANPEMAAGGQFIEQGVHGIDLFRWFMGDFVEAVGMTAINFFDKQPLEDNGMAVFRSEKGALAYLHASLTQWKNLFSFEVFGKDGYVIIEGLGSSYGNEKLIIGRRDFSGPFREETFDFRGADVSWAEEWKEFALAVRDHSTPMGNARDGLEAMRMAMAVYESEKTGRIIKLKNQI